MKMAITIGLFIILILLLGRTEICLSPFSIRMEGWMKALGWVLIFVGAMFVSEDVRQQGYKKAIEDVVKFAEEQKEGEWNSEKQEDGSQL